MPLRPVMLAEDDPDDSLLVQMAWKSAGFAHPLLTFTDGQSLLEALRRTGTGELPALVIVDLNMPRKGGVEVLAEMKADARLRSVPVVVLTTSREEEDILRSYRHGASGYITKPDRLEDLVAAIKALGTYWLTVAKLPTENGTP